MNEIETSKVQCPYCGEKIEILVDSSVASQGCIESYIEDCQVCCRPISVEVSLGSMGSVSVMLFREDD
jgi:hypothetical protein